MAAGDPIPLSLICPLLPTFIVTVFGGSLAAFGTRAGLTLAASLLLLWATRESGNSRRQAESREDS
ncbi:MAG: hypothetical protein DWI21_00420 [Planctomycetota bacterium]|nr:MAG: hypothetical protein DWI21_00420 [Planctomycetota bacterium]